MEDTRKYFDYKLAYDGYKRVKELLDKGGIQDTYYSPFIVGLFFWIRLLRKCI